MKLPGRLEDPSQHFLLLYSMNNAYVRCCCAGAIVSFDVKLSFDHNNVEKMDQDKLHLKTKVMALITTTTS